MSCHLRIGSDKAKLGQPEINLGLIPGFGGTQRLLRLAGRSAALELCLLGHQIDAARALALGVLESRCRGGKARRGNRRGCRSTGGVGADRARRHSRRDSRRRRMRDRRKASTTKRKPSRRASRPTICAKARARFSNGASRASAGAENFSSARHIPSPACGKRARVRAVVGSTPQAGEEALGEITHARRDISSFRLQLYSHFATNIIYIVPDSLCQAGIPQ